MRLDPTEGLSPFDEHEESDDSGCDEENNLVTRFVSILDHYIQGIGWAFRLRGRQEPANRKELAAMLRGACQSHRWGSSFKDASDADLIDAALDYWTWRYNLAERYRSRQYRGTYAIIEAARWLEARGVAVPAMVDPSIVYDERR